MKFKKINKLAVIILFTISVLPIFYAANKRFSEKLLIIYKNTKITTTPIKISPSSSPTTTTDLKIIPTISIEKTLTTINNNRMFIDNFNRNELISEVGHMYESTSKEWWLNSGAYLYINNGVARTIVGELPSDDPRRIDYNIHNPGETDNGFHPQNIFRLITKSKWTNYEQTAYYKIDKYILSSDSHRQPSNGILLFNHYQDGQTLYYTGLRVDGYAVIKKKYKGTYFNISYLPFIKGKYNRDTNPNLIPLNTWIGIKSIVQKNSDGSVAIKLYIDIGKTGDWTLAVQGVDLNNKYSNTPVISQEGYAGIRTDFMDVEFSDYSIKEINNN